MAGHNISDVIEDYLKNILLENQEIEIRRSDVANQFDVVPSQINYVIKTRFTIQNGYLVESKRGGGGYIRIEKVKLLDNIAILDSLIDVIGDFIDERSAQSIIQSLYEDEVLSKREAQLILISISKRSLLLGDSDLEDHIRANILVEVLNSLRYEIKI